MNASALRIVLDFLFLTSLLIASGPIFGLTLLLFPLTESLARTAGGDRLLRAFVSRMYVWSAVAGSTALPCAVVVPLAFPELRGPWVAFQSLLLIICILLPLSAANALDSRTRARDVAASLSEELLSRSQLRRYTFVNLIVMTIWLTILASFVARPTAKTSGIVEPNPVDRARLEWQQIKKKSETPDQVIESKNRAVGDL